MDIYIHIYVVDICTRMYVGSKRKKTEQVDEVKGAKCRGVVAAEGGNKLDKLFRL